MTEFLSALKADFLDRRLLPFIALVVVALAAAIGYVALDSGSSPPAIAPTGSPSVTAQTGASHLTISQLTPEKAVTEVPTGASAQHDGYARNPFAPVVAPSTKSAGASKSSAQAGSPSSTSSAGTGGSNAEPKTKEPAPIKKSTKPKIVYHVAALFGLIPPGGATPGTALTPFVNIPLLTPLPSAQSPLVVFRGVTTGGKSATFTVVGEVILHGGATCLPSEQQCEAIDLPVGKSETLEYLPASGPVQVYELKIVSISSSKASAAAAHSLLTGASKAGRELLRRSGLLAIPFLHYSSQIGVLAFASRKEIAARAHGARRR